MKELPKVYVNPIDKDFQNNKDMYYSTLKEDRSSTKDILRDIDKIFHSKDFVYKSEVEIETEDDIITTTLVGKNDSSLLTLDGKVIPIIKIKSIKKIG